MKKILILMLTLILVAAAAVLTACKKKPVPIENEPVYIVILSKTQVSLLEFEDETITAQVTDEEGNAVDKPISWSSSDTATATVTNGNIVGLKPGAAIVIAAVGDAKAECSVTVTASGIVPIIALNTPAISLFVGDNFELQASISYGGRDYGDGSFTFAAAAGQTAITLTDEGKVTAVAVGGTTVTITAAWRGLDSITLTRTINVSILEMVSLGFEQLGATVYTSDIIGGSLTADIVPIVLENGDDKVIAAITSRLTWMSDDNTLVNVTKTANGGTVTASGQGKTGATTIYYTYQSESGTTYTSVKLSITVEMPTVILPQTSPIELEMSDKTNGYVFTLAPEMFNLANTVDLTEVTDANDVTHTVTNGKFSGVTYQNTEVINVLYGESTIFVTTDLNYRVQADVLLITKVINNKADLAAFPLLMEDIRVSAGKNTSDVDCWNFYGYYVLGDNIDFSSGANRGTYNGPKASIVAAMDEGFKGIFDGRGYRISNIDIKNVNNSPTGYFNAGLFSKIGVGGRVENLALTNVRLILNMSNGIGGVIGRVSKGTLENLFVEFTDADIGGDAAGLVTSMGNATILNCVLYYDNYRAAAGAGPIIRNSVSGQTVNTVRNCFVIKDTVKTGEADFIDVWGVSGSGNICDPAVNTARASNNFVFANAGACKTAITAGTADISSFDTDLWNLAGNYPVFIYKTPGLYLGFAESSITLQTTNELGNSTTAALNVMATNNGKSITTSVIAGITWVIGNTSIISISGGANPFTVTALAEGSTTISYKYTPAGEAEEMSVSIPVTVEMPTVILPQTSPIELEMSDKAGGYVFTLAPEMFDLANTVSLTGVSDTGDFTYSIVNNKLSGIIYDNTEVINVLYGKKTIFVTTDLNYRVQADVLFITKVISNKADLEAFPLLMEDIKVSAGKNTSDVDCWNFYGYYVLGDNIDFSSGATRGAYNGPKASIVAAMDEGFKGVFDGRGYRISNIDIKNVNNSPTGYFNAGLFSKIGVGGRVENLALTNVRLVVNMTNGIGGVIGRVSKGTLENLFVEFTDADIGADAAGLVTSMGNAAILNCVLYYDNYRANAGAGPIIRNSVSGQTANTVRNCFVIKGTVKIGEADFINVWGVSGSGNICDPASNPTRASNNFVFTSVADCKEKIGDETADVSSFDTAFWDFTNDYPVFRLK